MLLTMHLMLVMFNVPMCKNIYGMQESFHLKECICLDMDYIKSSFQNNKLIGMKNQNKPDNNELDNIQDLLFHEKEANKHYTISNV